ncbi:MAG TPA: DUF1702 family protein [Candidatus Sulfotelmatobacter sp.]|nr:DUF1702 family protein [Candidatus Sulfotelmatobacter sp.]
MPGLIQRLLAIDSHEVEFARRGFSCADPQIQIRLENIGRAFLDGYHSALRHGEQSALVEQLQQVALEARGFAYEGAAMALALFDAMRIHGNALPRFIAGSGKPHVFMLHVGAGWAYARIPWKRRHIEKVISKFHPVLGWLIVDGYGFHEGYFHGRDQGRITRATARLSVDARRVFHQGLGRSLWFSNGADGNAIAHSISNFALLYREDAWSGVGLACAYAGGISARSIEDLRRQAGEYAAAVAQGVAFAAKARQLAGNPAAHTELACSVLCGMHAEEAAALCDVAFQQIDPFHACTYQHWRRLLQSFFSSSQTFQRGKSDEYQVTPPVGATKPH